MLIKAFVVIAVGLGLSACSSNRQLNNEGRYHKQAQSPVVTLPLGQKNFLDRKVHICTNAGRYQSTVVGTGHCVSFIQECSGAPLTRYWREGANVRGQVLEKGTVIATFDAGRYPNKTGWHAAIYISQDEQGIWVWDQWIGKPVHKRLIRFKNGRGMPNNDGDAYSIVN